MDAQTLATILGAGGVGFLAQQLFTGVRGLLDGRHQREKEQNVDALTQRDSAVRERDASDRARAQEASARRRVEEYASLLRRMLIEQCGIEPARLPPWPAVDQRPAPPDDGQPADPTTD